MTEFKTGRFFSNMPIVTRNLLIINVLLWLAAFLSPDRLGVAMVRYGGLHYWESSLFNPLQLVTYMFLHDYYSLGHVFFNMFSLVMFGVVLERVWGTKRFLLFYFVTGIGAALVQEAVWTLTWEHSIALADSATGQVALTGKQALNYALQHHIDIEPYLNAMVTIGASGAVFGVLLAFGMLFPNVPMYIFFIPIPIKAKWVVLGYGLLELFFGVSGLQGNVAHFAHLGGMLFGLILILYWRKKGIGGEQIY